LPTSSAFLRAVRTSSVSSAICLLVFLNCFPALPTCLVRPSRPLPVPGIGTPSTFFGFRLSRLPSTTPPTRPAAAVTAPVTTAVFEAPPLELFARLRDDAGDERRLAALELLGLALELLGLALDAFARELPEDLARVLDDFARELDGFARELDDFALELDDFAREPDDLVFDALALAPFELRDDVVRLLEEDVFAWAMTPP
jgi:hypothetical protein